MTGESLKRRTIQGRLRRNVLWLGVAALALAGTAALVLLRLWPGSPPVPVQWLSPGQRLSVAAVLPPDGRPAFWINVDGRDVLAILRRDTRSEQERNEGRPSPNDIGFDLSGHRVTVSGVVKPLPPVEMRSSWNLTDQQTAALAHAPYSLRVDRVLPSQ